MVETLAFIVPVANVTSLIVETCVTTDQLVHHLSPVNVIYDASSIMRVGWCQQLGGGYFANFLHSIIFPDFPNYRSTGYRLNITFIFVRCHHSEAVVTPAKYECDSKHIIHPFTKTEISITKPGKSEGFDSCDRPSDLTQIGFKSSINQPVWPWNLMYDLEKQ